MALPHVKWVSFSFAIFFLRCGDPPSFFAITLRVEFYIAFCVWMMQAFAGWWGTNLQADPLKPLNNDTQNSAFAKKKRSFETGGCCPNLLLKVGEYFEEK